VRLGDIPQRGEARLRDAVVAERPTHRDLVRDAPRRLGADARQAESLRQRGHDRHGTIGRDRHHALDGVPPPDLGDRVQILEVDGLAHRRVGKPRRVRVAVDCDDAHAELERAQDRLALVPACTDEEEGPAFHVGDANGGYDRGMDEATAQRLIEEQQRYYRARAPEYDDWWLRRGDFDLGAEENARWMDDVAAAEAELERFVPHGDVLELAAGTGVWTRHLARLAKHVTAVDAAPEALALNRERVADDSVEYVLADIFAWEPARRYDACIFGFWLSHVPSSRFAEFWKLVERALVTGGRVLFVDNAVKMTGSTGVQLDAERVRRTIADGREFEIVKRWYEPRALEAELRELGWTFSIRTTPNGIFIVGEGSAT
jgi:SAM-dependent methyltransferase